MEALKTLRLPSRKTISFTFIFLKMLYKLYITVCCNHEINSEIDVITSISLQPFFSHVACFAQKLTNRTVEYVHRKLNY